MFNLYAVMFSGKTLAFNSQVHALTRNAEEAVILAQAARISHDGKDYAVESVTQIQDPDILKRAQQFANSGYPRLFDLNDLPSVEERPYRVRGVASYDNAGGGREATFYACDPANALRKAAESFSGTFGRNLTEQPSSEPHSARYTFSAAPGILFPNHRDHAYMNLRIVDWPPV